MTLKEWRWVLMCDPCAYCGRPSGGVDHIDARQYDGSNDGPDNLTAVCMSCNSSKARLTLLSYLLKRTPHWRPCGFSSLNGRFDIDPEIEVIPSRGWAERRRAAEGAAALADDEPNGKAA